MNDDLRLEDLGRRLHEGTVHHDLPVVSGALLTRIGAAGLVGLTHEGVAIVSLRLRALPSLLGGLFGVGVGWPGRTLAVIDERGSFLERLGRMEFRVGQTRFLIL